MDRDPGGLTGPPIGFLVAVAVLILRAGMADRLTDAARWLALVPPGGSALLTLAPIIYG